MPASPWFVFAGGGTGGHLFPALAVVDALRALGNPVDVSFFCTERPMDGELLGAAGIDAVPQSVRPLATRPWHWPGFLLHWWRSVGLCRDMFQRRRPAAVVGAGGYASGPPVHAALGLGVPTFLLNPDAVPGRANRHLARRGRLRGIFAQWEVTRGHLPGQAPVSVTGCPVRPMFRPHVKPDRALVWRSFGLEPGLKTLLVTGASQGARTVNDAVLRVMSGLELAGWQVLHLAGAADAERVGKAYGSDGVFAVGRRVPVKALPFTERMGEAMLSCDLVISRAGASTLAEILAAGKPSILMPYPYHRDEHQLHNARVLVDAGAAVLVRDLKEAGANAERLCPVLRSLLGDDAKREQMGRAARLLDRPDSAVCIARQLVNQPQGF
ncbi:MAG TPA: UDP-N-acetylglucosamine--N-acetylmuramyl-(pentapeptide) pyrophosphoryl-undecaprenol N-acetylglucosamine transferase [Phycisphaerae bacterium]|nr:UDP-N-acetylglucosamine--N-acetylmuramyl-(pentapeptide) pyrophosphoryl-undecaprenol N-acetylglucosamine transferase [Phycisphaerae bacterium]HRY67040.1 UDP-N-acetylglucosamine--N-acetylmuramyl-(pentapeptide) pyrophosphoryl-undecaprenol N-acetylglucosamine transferase [Phycisphaerae bacterium]HSA27737.1 UDP-N-acetylglucosamine--N-acetylmuramyl-(pentapeptide) pyrophosphoryl-undecaprenol N-acetylglucosamine transferase [Phycisphaerae bacterium]